MIERGKFSTRFRILKCWLSSFLKETIFAAFIAEFGNLFQIETQSGKNDFLCATSLHLIGLIEVLPPLKLYACGSLGGRHLNK